MKVSERQRDGSAFNSKEGGTFSCHINRMLAMKNSDIFGQQYLLYHRQQQQQQKKQRGFSETLKLGLLKNCEKYQQLLSYTRMHTLIGIYPTKQNRPIII